MRPSKKVLQILAAMLAGALLTLGVQFVGQRWSRPAEAATLDEIARSGVAQLINSIPWVGEKIRGVAGLGDGRTFIIHTDDKIFFYQFAAPSVSSSSPVR